MKRLISGLVAMVMLITAAGCSSAENTNSEGSPENENINFQSNAEVENIDLTGEVTGEITVKSFEAMFYTSYLEKAAQAFEEKYPGTKVTIESFSEMPEVKTMESEDGTYMVSMSSMENNPEAKSDYLTQLNTELMGGKGPDILAMDIIPFYKYAEMGFLEDLNAYINSDTDFNEADYWMEIIRNGAYKGGVYVLPVDYTYSLMTYNTNMVSLDDITQQAHYNYKDIFEQLRDKTNTDELNKLLSFYGAENAFYSLFNQNYSSFVDLENRKANFTNGDFAKLLEYCKMLEEEGYIRETDKRDFSDMDIETIMSMPFEEYKYAISEVSDMMLSAMFMDVGYSISFGGADASEDENNEILGSISNDNGEVGYSFRNGFGINSNSENKRTAWEFMKFLISYESQMSAELYGSVVNKQASRDRAKIESAGNFLDLDRDYSNLELTAEEQAVFDQYYGAIEKYTNQLNKVILTDTTVSDMVDSEVEDFFKGVRSAEETAQRIQNKVELYLNE